MRGLTLLGGSSLAMMGALVFAAGACNALVSAGDYTFPEADATGAMDGGAGASEAGQKDGSVDASDGGGTTADATANSSFQNLLSACLLRAGCDWMLPDHSISNCVTLDTLAALSGERKFANLKNCTEFTNLTGRGFPTNECAGVSDSGGLCKGNKFINCGVGGYRDCTKHGATCTTVDLSDAGGKYVVGCAVASCTTANGTTGCASNGAEYTCYEGTAFGMACSLFSTTCDPAGACASMGIGPCAAAGAVCKQHKIVQCAPMPDNTLQAYEFDCTQAGLDCAVDANGNGHCLAPGRSLTDAADCHEQCRADGKTAKICVGGAPLDVNCGDYGFSHCVMRGDKADRAQCRN